MGETAIRFLKVMSFIKIGDNSFDIFDVLISDDLIMSRIDLPDYLDGFRNSFTVLMKRSG